MSVATHERHAQSELSKQELIKVARQRLAQSAGITISDEPFALDAEQAKKVGETDFGLPSETRTASYKAIREAGVDLGAIKSRLDRRAAEKIHGRHTVPGEVVEMLGPADPLEARFVAEKGIQSPVAALNRADGLTAAMNLLNNGTHASYPRIAEPLLAAATVELYNSPENGAPTLAQRTIEMPEGTIVEMNAYGAGSGQIIDSQVCVIPK